MVLVDYALGVPSPKLQVPNKFKVSLVEELEIKGRASPPLKNICSTAFPFLSCPSPSAANQG